MNVQHLLLQPLQDKAGSFEDTLVNLKGTISTDRDELKILKDDREDYQKVPNFYSYYFSWFE